MQMSQANRFVSKYRDKDIREIVFLMRDALNKHYAWLEKAQNGIPWNKSERITLEETFLLGLRYSEFYAEGSSNEDYCQAEDMRGLLLDKLGYTREEINRVCYDLLGWR